MPKRYMWKEGGGGGGGGKGEKKVKQRRRCGRQEGKLKREVQETRR